MKKIFHFLALFLACISQQINASQLQTTTSIQDAIGQYIAIKLPFDSDYEIAQSQFDNRLQLSLCKEKLDVFSRTKSIKAGRNSIGVRCNSEKRWTIYASVYISIYKNVITTSQPIRRGDIFSANSLQFKRQNIATLRSGYFTDLQMLIGKQATRNLSLDSIISQLNVTEPKVIKRREKVQIRSISPNLEINSEGVALMDGIKDQTIKVKNLKSRKIIQAKVVKTGLVAVSF